MYHLISTVKGKVKIVHAKADYDYSKQFHGRYTCPVRAAKKALELNKKRGV